MRKQMIAQVKMDLGNDLDKRLEIKAEASELPIGATTNDISCPWCGRSKSFSVTKTKIGDILFMCHRANCNPAASGYIRGDRRGSSNTSSVVSERNFIPRVFDYPTSRVAGEQLSKLVETYRITSDEVYWAEWSYVHKTDRYAMPVFSPTGACRGIVTKAYKDGIIPKSISYKEVDDNWMGWYLRELVALEDSENKYSQVIVVEDLVSCLKASRYYPSVALLGTHLNHKMLEEILGRTSNVVLCLDRDATQKALDYCKEFAIFGNFRAIPLSKDIKDMNTEELADWSERL